MIAQNSTDFYALTRRRWQNDEKKGDFIDLVVEEKKKKNKATRGSERADDDDENIFSMVFIWLFDDGIKQSRMGKGERERESLQGDFEEDNKTSRNDTWMLLMMMLTINFFLLFF